MFKFLSFLMMIPLLLCGHLLATIAPGEVTKVELFDSGKVVQMTESQNEELNKLLKESFDDCKISQSISIAVDQDVEKDRQEGVWLKFTFNKICFTEKMSYNELLLKVNKGQESADLIRGKNGKFSGRCINCALKGNLDKVYEFITSLSKPTIEIVDDENLSQVCETIASVEDSIETSVDSENLTISDYEFCDGQECFSEQKTISVNEENDQKHDEHGVIDVA